MILLLIEHVPTTILKFSCDFRWLLSFFLQTICPGKNWIEERTESAAGNGETLLPEGDASARFLGFGRWSSERRFWPIANENETKINLFACIFKVKPCFCFFFVRCWFVFLHWFSCILFSCTKACRQGLVLLLWNQFLVAVAGVVVCCLALVCPTQNDWGQIVSGSFSY